ncbi:MAG TPA: SRPBCC family protein [Chloroflexota bacterium]|nr:SRPBCC family protein [Chloroflexota bacterium]
MYCANTLRIEADVERVFALSADVERWPALLPHYRWVRVLRRADGRTWLDMAARRGAIPVRWQAVQQVFPAARLITYRHVGGVTCGMHVVWQLVPDERSVEVTIRHAFTPPWPLVGGWPAQLVVGRCFVEHIAAQTLRQLKAHAERTPGDR